MRLFVATTNAGKLRDFAHAVRTSAEGGRGGAGVQMEPLPRLARREAPAEDEATFAGNARLKAEFYSRMAPEELVLADDSGLEVTCLNDAPGVRSARYAEDLRFPAAPASTPDERNNAALLRELDGVPEKCRQARYRCALALARNGEVLATAEGMVEGSILIAPQGEGGFGYDPLFLVEGLDRTMAELELAERLEVSHRGRALRKLLEAWNG